MHRTDAQYWERIDSDRAAIEYVELISDRKQCGMVKPVPSPYWRERPFTQRVYANSIKIPLYRGERPYEQTGSAAIRESALDQGIAATLAISGMRVDIDCNSPSEVRVAAHSYQWSRNTASGGGLYPISLYRICVSNCLFVPGIYHYSPLHDAWELLELGKFGDQVSSEYGFGFVACEYIVVVIDFWRSAFKYADFSFQATSIDSGIVLSGLLEALSAKVDDIEVSFDSRDAVLDGLLALDTKDSTIGAVISLGKLTHQGTFRSRPVIKAESSQGSYSRSFPTITALLRNSSHVSRAERITARPRPSRSKLAEIPRPRVKRRSSSFGRFTGEKLSRDAITEFVAEGHAAVSRLEGYGVVPTVEPFVLATNVRGATDMVITYPKGARGPQSLTSRPDLGRWLTTTYFLTNYDIERVCAVFVLTCDLRRWAKLGGTEGYRAANAAIGAFCDGMYAFASQEQIGIGAILGFDPSAQAKYLDLDSRQTPVLNVLVGTDRPLACWQNSTLGDAS